MIDIETKMKLKKDWRLHLVDESGTVDNWSRETIGSLRRTLVSDLKTTWMDTMKSWT